MCASPAYLAVHGKPHHLDDLARHAVLQACQDGTDIAQLPQPLALALADLRRSLLKTQPPDNLPEQWQLFIHCPTRKLSLLSVRMPTSNGVTMQVQKQPVCMMAGSRLNKATSNVSKLRQRPDMFISSMFKSHGQVFYEFQHQQLQRRGCPEFCVHGESVKSWAFSPQTG